MRWKCFAELKAGPAKSSNDVVIMVLCTFLRFPKNPIECMPNCPFALEEQAFMSKRTPIFVREMDAGKPARRTEL